MKPENPLDNTEGLLRELFDPNEAIKAEFEKTISVELLQFSELLAPALKRFPHFGQLCDHNIQTALVRAFVHGVLDDLVVSVKLLLMGKLGPSGNTYRQALEGIAMAVMCAHEKTLLIGKKEQIYWQLIVDENKSSAGNLAASQLLANWDRLGLSVASAEKLKEALSAHHEHSHAGRLAMANRMDLRINGLIYFGGHFDSAKIEMYGAEMQQRINGARWAMDLINGLQPQMKKLAELTPPAR